MEKDCLGRRPIDEVDWSPHIGQHDVNRDWWKMQKTNHPVKQRTESAATLEDLAEKQQLLYHTVVDYYRDLITTGELSQLLLHVDGQAGTGKTTVIMVLCKELERLAALYGFVNPVLRAAPTGVAANGFSGKTIHSLFRIPIRRGPYERCLLYTSPSPRDGLLSRMPSSA